MLDLSPHSPRMALSGVGSVEFGGLGTALRVGLDDVLDLSPHSPRLALSGVGSVEFGGLGDSAAGWTLMMCWILARTVPEWLCLVLAAWSLVGGGQRCGLDFDVVLDLSPHSPRWALSGVGSVEFGGLGDSAAGWTLMLCWILARTVPEWLCLVLAAWRLVGWGQRCGLDVDDVLDLSPHSPRIGFVWCWQRGVWWVGGLRCGLDVDDVLDLSPHSPRSALSVVGSVQFGGWGTALRIGL